MTVIDFPDWNLSAPAAGVTWRQVMGVTGVGAGVTINSGFFYVGNFQTLVLETNQNVAQNATWQVNWVDSKSYLELPLWTDTFYKNTAGQVLAPLSVKSPYVYITVINNGAGFMNVSANLNGNLGGSAPGDAIMPQIISEGNPIAVPANTTTFIAVAGSIAGPVTLWSVQGSTGNVAVQHWNGTAWNILFQNAATASGGAVVSGILPADDVRIVLANTSGAAGNYFYSLAHGG
jgi:hypothetical protein